MNLTGLRSDLTTITGLGVQMNGVVSSFYEKSRENPAGNDRVEQLFASWVPTLTTAARAGKRQETLETPFRAPATDMQDKIQKFFEGSGFTVEFGRIKTGVDMCSTSYDLQVILAW